MACGTKLAWQAAALVALLGLGGCTAMTRPAAPHPTVTVEPGEPWRHVATVVDEQILGRLPATWAEALAQARKGGFAKAVVREGDLLYPEAALPRPAPSPGAYTCRLFTLGASPRGKPFVAGRSSFCFVGVGDGQLSLSAEFAPLKIGGYLWEVDGAKQMTFLGSSARGKGAHLEPYGQSPQSDVPGVFERVGEFRYRLILASPLLGGQIAILELKPAIAAS